ncbi:FAD:protein FMN transferase [Roseinatronobacter bogoriensis]|uniref:FAD:protein FMN transferase n=1 Tax=Roseinatronobacter bogoriensis subsp. barguzinensis TaxID=441209 RepID=A0A2K8KDF4_9RHOB|nr:MULTISPECIES: FAD:protein FMN transferase [Rhodobaca]ATX67471.1 FAD:protein FMN transferase [Rhodobaca barguzinensis]MBB4207060.1 thiamine biosynthesis lipoprotein [Rhodobaca bogoriensis DSM 18756]TDW36009.1 thiamine biosynthesis lipoprotein [Rhodobaca barguzinensis]TDY74022.1 thiamine biosynthesis lipoprotein [Rhodobaca bogoriensis DSM 18756]
MTLSRRRFLVISAVASALPVAALGQSVHHWRGVALGADASITLAHPDAPRIVAMARAEIARLEDVFSLHTPASALNRLNAAGRLVAPPPELLECLSHCATLHHATNGLFDPTIQPLWALYAHHFAETTNAAPPDATALKSVLKHVGFGKIRLDPNELRLKSGMALSLNGIAQGFIADKVAALLRAQGLTDVLVNTGEFSALGQAPDGQPWQIGLRAGDDLLPERAALRDAALSSSAAQGISFDGEGRVGHILNPKTGLPAPKRWRLVTVTAPQAWLADGLSTAFCLMTPERIAQTLQAFPQARIERLIG